MVVRGDRAYQYHVATQILREYRLTARPLRQEKVRTVEGMTYEEFERRFGCRRYRPGPRVTLSIVPQGKKELAVTRKGAVQ